MAIKLIALDMDGTSILPNQTISPAVITAIKEAQERNIKVIFASGRWHNAMKMHYPTIGTTGAQINCNGSTIVDTHGQIIDQVAMNPADASRLITELNSLGIPYGVCDLLNMYVTSYTQEADQAYRFHCIVQENLGQLPFISKITINNNSAEFYNHIKANYPLFQLAGAQEGHLEVWPTTTSKAVALNKVASLYNIDITECLAVGDGANDIEMLKAAGIGVAMGNGSNDVKKSANVIAPTLENDGVAWAINTYALD